jgi:cell division control protein 45
MQADLMLQGIALSIHFQKQLVHSGMCILDRHMVKTMKSYRFALLSDQEHFGLFAAYSSYNQSELPLIVAALNTLTDHFLVIGMCSGNSAGIKKK